MIAFIGPGASKFYWQAVSLYGLTIRLLFTLQSAVLLLSQVLEDRIGPTTLTLPSPHPQVSRP